MYKSNGRLCVDLVMHSAFQVTLLTFFKNDLKNLLNILNNLTCQGAEELAEPLHLELLGRFSGRFSRCTFVDLSF